MLAIIGLAETILIAVVSVLVATLLIWMLCWPGCLANGRLKSLDSGLIAYLSVILSDRLLGIPYAFYPIIRYSSTPEYSPVWLFWVGLPPSCFNPVSVVCSFFLTLYRILLVHPGYFFNLRLKRGVVWGAVGAVGGVVLGGLVLYAFHFPPNDAHTTCGSFCCVIGFTPCRFVVAAKLAFGTFNIGAGMFLLFLVMRQQRSAIKSDRKRKLRSQEFQLNLLILATVASDVTFNVLPHVLDLVLARFEITLAALVGPYSGIASTIHALLITALYYRKLLRVVSRPTTKVSTVVPGSR